MSATEKEPQPPVDALFFGYLEGLAFCGLFLSVLLPPTTAPFIWLAIPLVRFVTLVLRLLCLSHPARPEQGPRLAELLREGWPYQLPFWGAGLLFPLQDGQTTLAACGLFFQLGLLAILAVAARAQWSALSLIYLATLGWLCLWSPSSNQIALGVLCFGLTLNRTASPSVRCTARQSLALATAWLVFWLLPPLCQQAPSPLLVGWLLLAVGATALTHLAQKTAVLAEFELTAPGEVQARSWRFRRQSRNLLRPWAAFVALAVQSPQELGLFGLLFCAWWRSSLLATRCLAAKDHSVWWVAAETTLLWAFLHGGHSLEFLALSVLACPLVDRAAKRQLVRPELWGSPTLPALEDKLRQELRLTCPSELRARVLEESTTVELEKDLIATEKDLIASAPAGFRQRLLERLRKGRDDEDR